MFALAGGNKTKHHQGTRSLQTGSLCFWFYFFHAFVVRLKEGRGGGGGYSGSLLLLVRTRQGQRGSSAVG